MTADEQLAMAVHKAAAALSEAIAQANDAGLETKLLCVDVPDCDRPDDPPALHIRTEVSRPIRAA